MELVSNRSATSFEQVRAISTSRDSSNLLEAGRRPVRSQFNYAIWFAPGSKWSQTGSKLVAKLLGC